MRVVPVENEDSEVQHILLSVRPIARSYLDLIQTIALNKKCQICGGGRNCLNWDGNSKDIADQNVAVERQICQRCNNAALKELTRNNDQRHTYEA